MLTLKIPTDPCDAGYYLDQIKGCQLCPEHTYSATGNTAAECTACPDGKRVGAGDGTKESDCEWRKLIMEFLKKVH